MATIKEVARRAGVSVGTVSNVLAEAPSVSEDLRRRVQAAIAALDYRPSHVARSLKSKRTKTLGMVISDITNPFFPLMVRGAEDAAAEHGYMLSIFNSDDDLARERRICETLSTGRVDGLLLVPALVRGDDAHVLRLLQLGIPVVCLDRLPEGLALDRVGVDNAAGVRKAVSHLAGQGAKRIAFLGGLSRFYVSAERLAGFQSGMLDCGLKPIAGLIWEGDFRQESGYRAGMTNLGKMRMDAVFCANLPMALGWLRAMHEKGFSAPRDLLVATFDHLEILESFRPRLTGVAQPTYQIGRRGVLRLLERLQAPGLASEEILLDTELKIGETSLKD
jgi:LacI family transcriptional regulator